MPLSPPGRHRLTPKRPPPFYRGALLAAPPLGGVHHLITRSTPDSVAIRLYTALPADPSTIDVNPERTDFGTIGRG